MKKPKQLIRPFPVSVNQLAEWLHRTYQEHSVSRENDDKEAVDEETKLSPTFEDFVPRKKTLDDYLSQD